jgi:hypothetical protein
VISVMSFQSRSSLNLTKFRKNYRFSIGWQNYGFTTNNLKTLGNPESGSRSNPDPDQLFNFNPVPFPTWLKSLIPIPLLSRVGIPDPGCGILILNRETDPVSKHWLSTKGGTDRIRTLRPEIIRIISKINFLLKIWTIITW